MLIEQLAAYVGLLQVEFARRREIVINVEATLNRQQGIRHQYSN
jgi:hypothetical protein